MRPSNSAEVLGPDGPFARSLPGFRARAAQQELALKIESVITGGSALVAESGTGTGKTFAYLVPALLSGKRVMISTGTKPLQEQLHARDLPAVLEILDLAPSTALLKGRSNYLCLHRMESALSQGALGSASSTRLASISAWSKRTRSGDIGEFDEIGESDSIWQQMTSTPDNCVGAKCDFYESCFVNRARQRAQEAAILIVNHHLFCADLVLREDGFGRLLPGVDAVIFDEAHQLPAVASTFLGSSLTGNQIFELCRDTVIEEQREQSLVPRIDDLARAAERCLLELRAAMGQGERRVEWRELDDSPDFRLAWSALTDAVSQLGDTLEQAAPVGEGLTRCWQRALDLTGRLDRFRDQGTDTMVRWAETSPRSFRCHETPLDVGQSLAPRLLAEERALVFTSATLSVDGRFDYFLEQVGLQEAEQILVGSPFDYRKQALLYVPPAVPDPRQAEYTDQVITRVLPVLRASGGRAFLLFTSHRALRRAHDLLRTIDEFTLLEQGQAPRTELLARFRRAPRALLLGTASFWEGVDVQGDTLSCVVIDKLPFAAPDEPVLRARLASLEAQGRRPFVDHQLPTAVIALKQGVGRLIRDVADRGVLVLCDPRLISKSYGKVFLNSLPPMPLTRELSQVLSFFSEQTGRHETTGD